MKKLLNGQEVDLTTDEQHELMQYDNEQFNKFAHLANINQLHDELFNSILSEYGYASCAELSIWAQEPNNEYYKEANAIKEWYCSTWMSIKAYSETVTEVTAVEPQAFIDNLPKLIL